MKKKNVVYLFVLFLVFSGFGKTYAKANTPEGDIKWTTIDKALSDAKSGNKKFIFVDLYTDWCGWCKKMDEGAFTEANIVSLMNNYFTSVKFNAETQSPVSFNGKSYNFNKSGARGANQLALDIGSSSGKLGYPTLVVLDANGNKLQAFPGYKDVESLNVILKYFQSGNYKNMDFQQFQSGQ